MLSSSRGTNFVRRRMLLLFVIGIASLSSPLRSSAAERTTPSPKSGGEHPLDFALTIANASVKHIQSKVRDYTATLKKRARVDGELGELQTMELKVRHRRTQDGKIIIPMGVYLRFLEPDSVKGREVVWVEGRNDGKLIAHEPGLRNVANFYLDPTSYLAMRGQRYPITDIGVENLTLKLIEAATRDRKYGECEVRLQENVKVGDQLCDMIEVTHPIRREHFDFCRARVYFSRELNMPVRYASWSWPTKSADEPVLEEEYTYLNVRVNVGLEDRDFDVDNPDYRFW
jgi:hypothetical protein